MTGHDEPATALQRGALAGEFARLGYRRSQAGRKLRLAYSAALLGVDGLSSSSELTSGDAGRLIRMLHGCRTHADLQALAGIPGRPDETRSVAANATPHRAPRWQRDVIMIIFRHIIRGELAKREAAVRAGEAP